MDNDCVRRLSIIKILVLMSKKGSFIPYHTLLQCYYKYKDLRYTINKIPLKITNGFFHVVKCKINENNKYQIPSIHSLTSNDFDEYVQTSTRSINKAYYWFLKLNHSSNKFDNFQEKSFVNANTNNQLKFIIWTDPYDFNISGDPTRFSQILNSFQYYNNVTFISVPVKFIDASFPESLNVLEVQITFKHSTPEIEKFILNIEKRIIIPKRNGKPFKHLLVVNSHFINTSKKCFIFFNDISQIQNYYIFNTLTLEEIIKSQECSLTPYQFEYMKNLYFTKVHYPYF